MQWRNTPARYGGVAQAFHWVIAALVFTQIGLGIYGANLPLSFEKLVVLARHKSVGITILGIVILRFIWRLISPPPPLPAQMDGLQRVLAHTSHAALYALLVALPVTGLLYSSAAGISVSWFGIVAIPDLVAPDKALENALHTTHVALAITLGAVLLAHIGAALWHHFSQRDDVLTRMVPLLRRRQGDRE